MTFWEKITKLCLSRGITPNKLCKEIGLSNATATHWKNGTQPTVKNLMLIAKYFNIKEAELIQELYAIELFEEQKRMLYNSVDNKEFEKELEARDTLIFAYKNAEENIKQAINILLGIDIEIT